MEMPTLKSLYDERKPSAGSLLELLCQPVNEKLVAEHPEFAGFKYLPIEKCLDLLIKIFGTTFKVEILSEGYVSGSVWVVEIFRRLPALSFIKNKKIRRIAIMLFA